MGITVLQLDERWMSLLLTFYQLISSPNGRSISQAQLQQLNVSLMPLGETVAGPIRQLPTGLRVVVTKWSEVFVYEAL